jgi:predicted PurR-regulated permease PerM
VALLVWFVIHARFALSLIFASALISVALDHAVGRLTKRGLSRRGAIAIVVSAFLLVIVGVGFLFIPPMVKQARELVDSAPKMVAEVRSSRVYQKLDSRIGIERRIQQLSSEASPATAPAETAVRAVTGVVTGLAAIVTVFFVTLFMLLFGGPLVHGLMQQTTPERRDRYVKVARKIYDSVGGYISGLAVICGVNAVCTTILLAALRVPFFLPLGILSGLSSLVPLAGNTIVGTLIALVALASGGLWKGIAVGAFFIVYQQFENHVLGPIIYRRTVDLNPLVVVLSLLIMAELAGVPGAVVAVPVVAAGQIILREVLAMRRERLALPRPTEPPKDGSVHLDEQGPPLHS